MQARTTAALAVGIVMTVLLVMISRAPNNTNPASSISASTHTTAMPSSSSVHTGLNTLPLQTIEPSASSTPTLLDRINEARLHHMLRGDNDASQQPLPPQQPSQQSRIVWMSTTPPSNA